MPTFREQIDSFRDRLPSLRDDEVEKLARFHEILSDWNQKISLVSRSSFDRAVANHFADSLWSSEYAKPFVKHSVADIGTGAGFPGIVFAIRFPEIPVVLYEKLQKRRNYLEDLLKSLALPKVRLAGEITRREGADFYFARAVHPPGELLSWLSTFLKAGDKIALNLGSVRKEFLVPGDFKRIFTHSYQLPANEGAREIEVYERVPRGT